MKKLILSILIVSINFFAAKAQGIMSFAEETHDFGTIEEGTLASYEFEFTNTGNQAIEISNVQASCGCTTPFFTKERIQPGKKGKIKASYNSEGRPGAFMKSINVRSNAKKDLIVLYIKGFVNPKKEKTQVGAKYNTKTNIAEKTPPSISLDKSSHNFGRLESGTKVKQRFNIYNAGQTNLIITGLEIKNLAVSFGLSASVIGPDEVGILEITLDADKIQNMEEDFVIHTNDPKSPDKAIRLIADIYENFSKRMFKEKQKLAPFE